MPCRRCVSTSRSTDGRGQLNRLATMLMASATITAPKRYEMRACVSAILRIGFVDKVRVRDLKRHPNRKSEVGKVEVRRRVLLVEVDRTVRALIVLPGVAKHEDGVDGRPREHDADDPDRDEIGLGAAVGLPGLDQDEANGSQQRHPGHEDDSLGRAPAGVFEMRVASRLGGVQTADDLPGPGQIADRCGVPANEDGGRPRHEEGSHDPCDHADEPGNRAPSSDGLETHSMPMCSFGHVC